MYPLCGSAHPSILQHALFSGIPAGAKVVRVVARSIVITPVVCVCFFCFPLYFWCSDERCEVMLANSLVKASPHLFYLFFFFSLYAL